MSTCPPRSRYLCIGRMLVPVLFFATALLENTAQCCRLQVQWQCPPPFAAETSQVHVLYLCTAKSSRVMVLASLVSPARMQVRTKTHMHDAEAVILLWKFVTGNLRNGKVLLRACPNENRRNDNDARSLATARTMTLVYLASSIFLCFSNWWRCCRKLVMWSILLLTSHRSVLEQNGVIK